MACTLGYIPDRLHSNGRQQIDAFEVREEIYRRCTPEELENPFKSISLTELSHNRQGLHTNLLSYPQDVLFSIRVDDQIEVYTDKVVCTLEIIDLNPDNKYAKTFRQDKNGIEVVARMELIHEPESCMYPHCVFRIWVNDEIIKYENYNDTIKKLHQIRTMLKSELASMIRHKKISQS